MSAGKETFMELLPHTENARSASSVPQNAGSWVRKPRRAAGGIQAETASATSHNEEEAVRVIPLIHRLLGIETK